MLLEPPDPGHDLAVIEADDELHLHRHFAAQAFDDADDVRILAARRHKIDQANGATLGFNFRFENQRLSPVTAARGFDFLCRKKPPVPIFLLAEPRRNTWRRSKSEKTKTFYTAG